MDTNKNILLPFLQKVYSAFKHLERFSISNNFFDNISDLDGFFSEYRSSTFVLQKSLGGPANTIYQKNLKENLLKDEDLANWLNDKRVEAIHSHPIVLHKHLTVVVYSGVSSKIILEKQYSLEFDEPFENVKAGLIEVFPRLNPIEVNFSAKYIFTEGDKDVDVVRMTQNAISNMVYFMYAMLKDLKISDTLSIQLTDKIMELSQSLGAKPLSLVRDYYYLVDEQKFELGEVLESSLPLVRIPFAKFEQVDKQNVDGSHFEYFVSLHAMIYLQQHEHIMTTFFVKYVDDSVTIISFDASLRTTFYRKINEVAGLVANEDVDAVYLVTEFIGYKSMSIGKDLEEFASTPYSKRRENALKTMLVFFQIDTVGIRSIMASGESIKQLTSTEGVRMWKNGYDATLHNFLTPLKIAFNSKNKKEHNYDTTKDFSSDGIL